MSRDENANSCLQNDFLTVTSNASVSKGDIELLENKIKVLEKQISKIKKTHTAGDMSCSGQSMNYRASNLPQLGANVKVNVKDYRMQVDENATRLPT